MVGCCPFCTYVILYTFILLYSEFCMFNVMRKDCPVIVSYATPSNGAPSLYLYSVVGFDNGDISDCAPPWLYKIYAYYTTAGSRYPGSSSYCTDIWSRISSEIFVKYFISVCTSPVSAIFIDMRLCTPSAIYNLTLL